MDGQTIVDSLKIDALWTESRDEITRLSGEYWEARNKGKDAKARELFKRMGDLKPYRRTERRDGSTLYSWTMLVTNRYIFDEGLSNDWKTLNTQQDAPYYGVWINPVTMEIVSFCEGDITLIACHSREAYEEEVYKTVEFNRHG